MSRTFYHLDKTKLLDQKYFGNLHGEFCLAENQYITHLANPEATIGIGKALSNPQVDTDVVIEGISLDGWNKILQDIKDFSQIREKNKLMNALLALDYITYDKPQTGR